MHKFRILIFILFFSGFISNLLPVSKEEIDARIIKYRTREITLTVKNQKGIPESLSEVVIEETNQKFLFGCNIFLWGGITNNHEMQKLYREYFASLFNYATLPLYWGSYEPEKGKKDDSLISNIALWCRSSGIWPKGHPLVWHYFDPYWADYDSKTADDVLEKRVSDIVGKYKGLIDTFDAINESLDGPKHDNSVGRWEKEIGPIEASRRAISWVRDANPNAMILINDYNTTTAYASQINVLKELGFPPDAIGIQSHMHQGVWSDEQILDIVDRFSHYNIPIHFTEMTILSGHLKDDNDWFSYHPGWNTTPGGERYQAEQVERIYRLLFSLPSVEAITWWDLSDYYNSGADAWMGAWMGAPAGLLRKDMTPKPAYNVLHRLIREEWNTGPLKLTTDSNGSVFFRGFIGAYKIQMGAMSGAFKITEDTNNKFSVIVR